MTDSPAFAQLSPILAPGEVWLVGAGPGDPGLLTLHAINALAQADVVVSDALVAPEILAFAPTAEIRAMGKRGGRASPKQAEITAELIALAQAGRRVVRLKGGDPFVFGRGAEEALALAAAAIPFRVIPGITAGIGGLAMAGLPVTHGASNAAVTFATGHDTSGDTPPLDWEALARGAPVLVLYMAMRNLGEIAARLIAAGRPENEPVAIVQSAATPDQRVLDTRLATCAAEAEAAGIGAPAVVIIGPTVPLRRTLTAPLPTAR